MSSEQIVYSPLRDVQALAKGGSLRQDKKQSIAISFNAHDGEQTVVSVSRGKNKNIAVTVVGKRLGAQLQTLEEPFSVIAPGLAGIPAFEEYRSPGLVRRAAARGDANSVLRNILWALKSDAKAWTRFQERLASIFPDITLDVVFDDVSDEHISVQVAREGISLPLDSSGTGILQATQILAYVGLYKPKLLILDEPDSHLQPDNQRKLVHLLQLVAEEEELQVVYSTHSRHLMDEARKLDGTIHWVSSGQIQTGDFDLLHALMELGALDAGDRLRHGATPYLMLTEDSDLRYLEAIIQTSGLDRRDIQIWSYSSCTQLFAAQALGAFVKEHAPGTDILVHIDRDYRSEEQVAELEAKLRLRGLRPFMMDGVDIESHFLTPGHLSVVFSELSQDERSSLLGEAMKQCEDMSIAALINARVEEAYRARKDGEKQPNTGIIANQARNDYFSQPERYRHGKGVLKRLRRLAQERYGQNREIATPTNALAHPVLKEALAMGGVVMEVEASEI